MSWNQVLGHEVLIDRFRQAVARGRLASTFLFVGPDGVGKRRFAGELAKALLCQRHSESQLEACDECEGCHQMAAGSHPDFVSVAKPADRSEIPIDLLIGDRDHRNRKGLCHDISLSPFYGGRKIAIINDADFLNEAGANCLLKTLEEPPPQSVLFLLSTSLARQLPTIRSRCQVVHFQPLSLEHVRQILASLPEFEPTGSIDDLASLSNGSVQNALGWADPTMYEFRRAFLGVLRQAQWPSTLFAKQVAECVDQAGKEAVARRDRFRQIVGCAEEFYRNLASHLVGRSTTMDAVMEQAVTQAAQHWVAGPEGAVRCIDRCLDAESEVGANANTSLLVESWVDDLASHTNLRKGVGVHVY